MKYQFKEGIVLKEKRVIAHPLTLTFNQMTPRIEALLHHFLQGCEEERLVDTLDDGEEILDFFYILNILKKHALLIYQTPLLDLVPLNVHFSEKLTLLPAYSISRFALCRHDGRGFILETPLSPARIHLKTPDAFLLFQAFGKGEMLEKIVSQFSHLAIQDVHDAVMLLSSAQILITEEESRAAQQWEFHDLYFHSRSREGRHDAPIGGTFRFKGKIPSLPALKTCEGKKIKLALPKQELTLTLSAVLEKRQSIREYGTTPITLEQLGDFLYHSAHVKKVFLQGEDEFTKRPYPGGGARYELEIYLIVNQCSGLAPAIYHYHPLEHELCWIREIDQESQLLLKGAQAASGIKNFPPLLIIFGARFQRVSWKYVSMAYSVILKNTGVLYQTLYLVATAMGLAPCALGCGNSDLFCRVMGTEYLEESSVGEFMLGPLPD